MAPSQGIRTPNLQESIFKSLSNPRFAWRTPTGIAKEIGIDVEPVVTFLERSPEVIRASSVNKKGLPLYALRSRRRKETSLFRRVLSLFLNISD